MVTDLRNATIANWKKKKHYSEIFIPSRSRNLRPEAIRI